MVEVPKVVVGIVIGVLVYLLVLLVLLSLLFNHSVRQNQSRDGLGAEPSASNAVVDQSSIPVYTNLVKQGIANFPYLLRSRDSDMEVTCWSLVTTAGVVGLDCMVDKLFKKPD